MLRVLHVSLLAVALCAVLAGSAHARTFSVVGGVGATTFPSAEASNLPGSVLIPLAIMRLPTHRQELSFEELVNTWKLAGAEYDVPWQVLAAINQLETNFGRNMGPSSAGAVGWMQFLPSTWLRWGVDATGDGVADPWNATDAIYSAARYLAASGGAENIKRAIFSYNRADWYVDDVLDVARVFNPRGLPSGPVLRSPSRVFDLDPVQADIDVGEDKVDRAMRTIERAESRLDELTWLAADVGRRGGDPSLPARDFRQLEALAEKIERSREKTRGDLEAARAAREARQLAVDALRADAIAIDNDQPFATAGLAGKLPEPPTAAAAAIIDYAVRQLGVPYTWGGNHGFSLEDMIREEPSIWNGGFDCSSLVAWAFAKGAGLYVGDWTGSQWDYGATHPDATRGKGPARGGAAPAEGYLPGDLIFFNETDHVAIYLGNDLIIQAPRTGDVVKVTKLTGYLPVWGWVRWERVSGEETGAVSYRTLTVAAATPSRSGRVFTVVAVD